MKKSKIIIPSIVTAGLLVTSIAPVLAYSKEETVYSKLNSDGSYQTTIVSEHLKNDQNKTKLIDQSDLTEIENVNGDEKYKQSKDALVWKTKDGQDIYYQGKSSKQLPITMKVTYKLNGETTTVKKMLGKKGRVEIDIEYVNNEKQVVNNHDYYVPFVVTMATNLPTKTNSNVTVTNGKIVSNGSNNVVMAIAAPGLYEDFDYNEQLKDINRIVIEYDTTKFVLNSIISVANPSLLSNDDLDNFNQLDNVYDLMKQLDSSYQKILTGGKVLNQGLVEFMNKYHDFNQGVQALHGGVQQILAGSKQLNTGLISLNNALIQLDSNSSALNNGAKQTFNVLLTSVNSQIQAKLEGTNIVLNALTIENYEEELTNVLNQISAQATKQVINEVEKTVKAKVEFATQAALKQQVETTLIQELIQNKGMDESQANQYLLSSDGQTLLNTTFDLELTKAKENGTYDINVASNVQQQMNSQEIQTKIKNLVAANTSGKNDSEYMQIYNALVQLKTYHQFYTGLQQYTASVAKIKEGSKNALQGSNNLNDGLQQLQTNTNMLKEGSSLLNEAGNQLSQGSNDLTSGLEQFNQQGINKINNFINHDLKNNVDKVKILNQLSNDYNTFTKVQDGVDSKTKFVLIIDSKKK